MKKLLLLLVLVLAGVTLWAIQDGSITVPWSEGSTAATIDASSEPASLAQPAGATAVTVDYVHDGDTLFVVSASGERLKVRLIGVDTPEVGDGAECFGTEATDYLRVLLPVGSTAWVTPDAEALDRYGRSLFYLWTADGTFTNHALVAGGYGTALRIDPNDAYWPELSEAEAQAQNAGLGLWGGC